jgi:hypothetical protein
VLLVVACSGSKAKTASDDAVHAGPRGDTTAVAVDAGAAATGDLQVRIEWKDVPAAMRSSPGRTPCNTPRAPSLAPTTTWGIPEVVVIVPGSTPADEARVVLGDCTPRPRVAAGKSLMVASAVDRPAKVTLTKYGTTADLAALAAGDARTIQLPIAGHAVTIALDDDGVYQLATDAKEPETAWIVAGPAHVTEPTGQIVVRDLPTGARAVTAWLPPRGKQPARVATATATITANELVELTIDLAQQ